MPDQQAENYRQLEALVRQAPQWDYPKFEIIMVALTLVGDGVYLPAKHAPRSIDLSGLNYGMQQVKNFTDQTHREHSLAVLADWGTRTLEMSENITGGSRHRVGLDTRPAVGREQFQEVVLTIHAHPPESTMSSFSDNDYLHFMLQPEEKGMVLIWQDIKMLVLKTSVTRQGDSPSLLQSEIMEVFEDVRHSPLPLQEKIKLFNEEVCIMYGLTLFMAQPGSNTFERVQVVRQD